MHDCVTRTIVWLVYVCGHMHAIPAHFDLLVLALAGVHRSKWIYSDPGLWSCGTSRFFTLAIVADTDALLGCAPHGRIMHHVLHDACMTMHMCYSMDNNRSTTSWPILASLNFMILINADCWRHVLRSTNVHTMVTKWNRIQGLHHVIIWERHTPTSSVLRGLLHLQH